MKNIITRTITGIVYIIIILAGLVFPVLYLPVFGLVAILAMREFYTINGIRGWQRYWGIAGGLYIIIATSLYITGTVNGRIVLAIILFPLISMISELYDRTGGDHINNLGKIFLGQIYCAVPLAILGLILHSGGSAAHSPLMAIALFSFVWINDTGAFLAGSAFGRRRLFERISPRKSWEGFAGGLLLTMAAAMIPAHLQAYRIYGKMTVPLWIGLAAVTVIFATFGDLVESLMKRTVGVKDSGSILPGHGGMLDRMDSIFMAIPAAYIFLSLLT